MNTFNNEVNKKALDTAKLVIRKQQDYGKGNILNSVVDPKIAIAVRLQDKLSRLANLAQSGADPKNESLADTAQDIVGYGLILMMVIDDTFKLPMEEENE